MPKTAQDMPWGGNWRLAIEIVAAAAKEHGTTTFGTSMLQLAPFVQEQDLGLVGVAFPALLPRYERAYPATNAPRDYLVGLEAEAGQARIRQGLEEDVMRRPGKRAGAVTMAAPPEGPERQLVLPL